MSKQKEIAKWCACTICDTLVWIALPVIVVNDEEEICLGIICDKCASDYPVHDEQDK